MNIHTHHLVGKIRNIHPSRPSPTWEVCFDPKVWADDFPSTHETWIEVEWPAGPHRSMIGIKPDNRIYLRSKAASTNGVGGKDSRVTDLCTQHGLGRAGPITFEVVEPRARYRVVLP